MISKQMEEFIKAHEKEACELLLALAKIPAPSNHEEKRAEFCSRWLKAQGARGVYIDEALNVIYPVQAAENQPVEVYMAHTDVVFPDETELPLTEDDERIHCPGVGDDTACLAALLLTAKFIAKSIEDGTWQGLRAPGAPGLILVCNSGEEGLGNLKGVRAICEAFGSRMTAFCTFDGQMDHIVDKAVGSNRYRVILRTQGGHSFSHFGNDNAIEKLAAIIVKLYGISVPEGGKTTYNVGLISGGTSVNTIAQQAEMLYEFRSDVKANLTYMEQEFLAVIEAARKDGLDVSYEIIGVRPCAGDVDADRQGALLERAMRATKTGTGSRPLTSSGSTDCNIPLSLGIPSVCVGAYMGAGAHTREEYVEKASLPQGYRVVFDMILGGE